MADEKELIDRAKTGDEWAFAEIVRHHQGRVFRVCLAALGDRQAADEAAQDVFVKLFESIGRFRGASRLSTWLYRVSLNVCADRRRSRWWLRWLRTDPDDRAISPDRPDRRMEDREMSRDVLAALQKLPASFREVLVLREMEEREYAEIAAIVGVSIGTVESRLFRARAKLKAILLEGSADKGV